MKREDWSECLQLAYLLRNEGLMSDDDLDVLFDLVEKRESLREGVVTLRKLGTDAPPNRLNRRLRLFEEASIDVLEHIWKSLNRDE